MATPLRHYRLHGICVRSRLALPATEVPARSLQTPDCAWEVTIRCGDPWDDASPPLGPPWQTRIEGDTITLEAAQLGRFQIRSDEIVAHPLVDLDPRLLCQALVGAPLAVWLHQRGRHLIHGSALSVGERAIGIVGPSGTGKSTLSAALWHRGNALVADDLMALDMDSGTPRVFPGAPYLKLWPASIEAMDQDPESLPRLYDDVQKRRLDATAAMATNPLPLAAIYTLRWGNERTIEQLGPNEAFAALLANTFVCGVLSDPADQTHQRHFEQATQIAECVPVRRVSWVRSLDGLPGLARRVEEDALAL